MRANEIKEEIRKVSEKPCDCILSIRNATTCWRCIELRQLWLELKEVENEMKGDN